MPEDQCSELIRKSPAGSRVYCSASDEVRFPPPSGSYPSRPRNGSRLPPTPSPRPRSSASNGAPVDRLGPPTQASTRSRGGGPEAQHRVPLTDPQRESADAQPTPRTASVLVVAPTDPDSQPSRQSTHQEPGHLFADRSRVRITRMAQPLRRHHPNSDGQEIAAASYGPSGSGVRPCHSVSQATIVFRRPAQDRLRTPSLAQTRPVSSFRFWDGRQSTT